MLHNIIIIFVLILVVFVLYQCVTITCTCRCSPREFLSHTTHDGTQLLGIVGGYQSGLKAYNSSSQILPTLNVSWILQLQSTPNFIINDEHNAKLYLLKRSQNNWTITKKIDLSTYDLASPVYMVEHNNSVYVACYGNGQIQNAGIMKVSKTLDKIDYISTKTNKDHRFHCIDVFRDFLIAVDIEGGHLYKLNDNKKLAEFNWSDPVFSFPASNPQRPRHFVAISNDRIVVITEYKNASTNAVNSPLLCLLEWSNTNNKFTLVTTYNLSQLKGNQFSTGAEIKYYKNQLYVTNRRYDKEFSYATPPSETPPSATPGVFHKFDITDSKFVHVDTVEVGRNPRYFTIENDIAYVCNQESNSISRVAINPGVKHMNIIPDKQKKQYPGAAFISLF